MLLLFDYYTLMEKMTIKNTKYYPIKKFQMLRSSQTYA